jgi:hypothetical protein
LKNKLSGKTGFLDESAVAFPGTIFPETPADFLLVGRAIAEVAVHRVPPDAQCR